MTRKGHTHRAVIGRTKVFITINRYDTGEIAEVFVIANKAGDAERVYLDAISSAISIGLQHGVPLSVFIDKYRGVRCDDGGITDHPRIRIANSVLDYLAKYLELNQKESLWESSKS